MEKLESMFPKKTEFVVTSSFSKEIIVTFPENADCCKILKEIKEKHNLYGRRLNHGKEYVILNTDGPSLEILNEYIKRYYDR